MGSSLQEQLLKAGLVTEQQLRGGRARSAPGGRRQKRTKTARPSLGQREPQSPSTAASHSGGEAPATQTLVAEQPHKQEKTVSASERKLLRARIKILLRRHRVNDPDAETPYHFLVGKQIRRIYVTEAQHASLRQGQLVIIPFGERHYLVSSEKLAALQQLDPNLNIIQHPGSEAAESEGDDSYAGYRVPDDLIW